MVSAKKRTATKKASTGKGKASTVFPSGRIGSLLRKGRFSKRVSKSASTPPVSSPTSPASCWRSSPRVPRARPSASAPVR